jgi:hypothetical protein
MFLVVRGFAVEPSLDFHLKFALAVDLNHACDGLSQSRDNVKICGGETGSEYCSLASTAGLCTVTQLILRSRESIQHLPCFLSYTRCNRSHHPNKVRC